jgi:hypothetical protein
MLERRGEIQRYSRQQTEHWLAWLADQMRRRSQTVFFIEHLQPDWLSSRAQQQVVIWGVAALFGLIGLLAGFASVGPLGGLAALPAALAWFAASAGYGRTIDCVERLGWSWRRVRASLWPALRFGLVAGLLGLAMGLLLYGGNVIGGILFMVLGGLPFSLFLALINGIVGSEAAAQVAPNQGIRRSGRTALRVGLVVILTTGALLGLASLVVPVDAFSAMVFLGPSFGLYAALRFGGRAVLQHALLRLLLWMGGAAPWNYAAFLNYATSLFLLRRVGGGYVFVHRLLLEHFAELHTQSQRT